MSFSSNFNAAIDILNTSNGARGAGIAVCRDTQNNLLVATAAHVVNNASIAAVRLIDFMGRAYDDVRVLIYDHSYDYALLLVKGVPTNVPAALVRKTTAPINNGDDAYIIGYPLGMDTHSVSAGVIRSKSWSINGVAGHILTSIPALPGNSGGGAFLKSTHELIGVCSFGVNQSDGVLMNGFIPFSVIYESILYYMYRPTLALAGPPVPTHREAYYVGMLGYLNDPQIFYALSPSHAKLRNLGRGGFIVMNVAPGSPASAAGFTNAIMADAVTFQVVWAVLVFGRWTLVNEESPLNVLLDTLTRTYAMTTRPFPRTKARAASSMDIVFRDTMSISLLVSRVVNGMHNNVYETVVVTMVKRSVYLQRRGNIDISPGILAVYV